MNTHTREFKSRWGYHPCNRELFLKLKRLHACYWQTLYEFHRWHRWWRKAPQNRRGAEPAYCTAFVEDRTWLKPVTVHGEPGYNIYPKTIIDHGIVARYHAARMPQPEPVPPLDAETVAQIESLYEEVQQHFNN